MNRDIKFRGKRVDNKEWAYGFLIYDFEEGYRSQGIDDVPPRTYQTLDLNGNRYSVELSTVGQYTGLKDKEGKEIYEGDIMGGYPHGSAYVSYNEEYACFESRNIDADLEVVNGLFANDLKDCFNEWSILGNIHDNPELNKEKTNAQ